MWADGAEFWKPNHKLRGAAPEGVWSGAMILILLAILFAGMWLLGVMATFTLGGFIHILLLLALASLILKLLNGRHAL